MAERELETSVLHPPALRGARIVVVDDDPDCALLMGHALRLAGATVEIAHSADSALAAARAVRPEAVVVDVRLVGRDGREFVEELRREPWAAQLASVLVSAYPPPPDVASRFLEKPFSMQVFRQTVAEALGDRTRRLPDPGGVTTPETSPAY